MDSAHYHPKAIITFSCNDISFLSSAPNMLSYVKSYLTKCVSDGNYFSLYDISNPYCTCSIELSIAI